MPYCSRQIHQTRSTYAIQLHPSVTLENVHAIEHDVHRAILNIDHLYVILLSRFDGGVDISQRSPVVLAHLVYLDSTRSTHASLQHIIEVTIFTDSPDALHMYIQGVWFDDNLLRYSRLIHETSGDTSAVYD